MADAPTGVLPRWREVDRALRDIARRRAALDAEEVRWLREAEHLKIWKRLGMVSALDYLERALGYAPRTAQDRLRVARALAHMPRLDQALARGELPFSAVRELSRVAVPETEALWCGAALGKNLREIEELVSGHAQGDKPTDPPTPSVRPRNVTFELPSEVYALLRQARVVLDTEHGRHLDDHDLVAAMCRAVLDRGSRGDGDLERTAGRAKCQIAFRVCPSCKQGTQIGGGRDIAVSEAVIERAMCDANVIGSLDGDLPERASQTIPPAIRRFVLARDGYRCQTPGCRSTIGVEAHHIKPVSEGGTHHPSNITSRCDCCHVCSHDGRLLIEGTAPDAIVTTWLVPPTSLDAPVLPLEIEARMPAPEAGLEPPVVGLEHAIVAGDAL